VLTVMHARAPPRRPRTRAAGRWRWPRRRLRAPPRACWRPRPAAVTRRRLGRHRRGAGKERGLVAVGLPLVPQHDQEKAKITHRMVRRMSWFLTAWKGDRTDGRTGGGARRAPGHSRPRTRVAARQPAQRQVAAHGRAVLLQRLQRIARAGGLEAGRAQPGRQQQPVAA
jgi:hypothetical protein